jgi:hypothetical protein
LVYDFPAGCQSNGRQFMADDPDILVDLASAASEFEAESIVSELAANGIIAKAISVADATLRPLTQQAIRIAVRRVDLDRSMAVLQSVRSAPKVSDWSDVDTGDTSPLTKAEMAAVNRVCPTCEFDLSGPGGDSCPTCGASIADRADKAALSSNRGSEDVAAKRTARILAVAGIVLVGAVLILMIRGLVRIG